MFGGGRGSQKSVGMNLKMKSEPMMLFLELNSVHTFKIENKLW